MDQRDQRARVGRDGSRRARAARRAGASIAPPATTTRKTLLADPQLEARLEVAGDARGRTACASETMCESRLISCRRGSSGARRAPAAERDEHGLELAAPARSARRPGGGGRRQPALAHDADLLELAQALREHVRARVREPGAEVGEALRAEQQLAHDQQRPALADEVEGAGDAARLAVCALAWPWVARLAHVLLMTTYLVLIRTMCSFAESARSRPMSSRPDGVRPA